MTFRSSFLVNWKWCSGVTKAGTEKKKNYFQTKKFSCRIQLLETSDYRTFTCPCLVPRPGQSTWLEELMNGLLIH